MVTKNKKHGTFSSAVIIITIATLVASSLTLPIMFGLSIYCVVTGNYEIVEAEESEDEESNESSSGGGGLINDGEVHDDPYALMEENIPPSYEGDDLDYYDVMIPYKKTPEEIGGMTNDTNTAYGAWNRLTDPRQANSKIGQWATYYSPQSVGGSKGYLWGISLENGKKRVNQVHDAYTFCDLPECLGILGMKSTTSGLVFLGITGQGGYYRHPKCYEPDTTFVWDEYEHGYEGETFGAVTGTYLGGIRDGIFYNKKTNKVRIVRCANYDANSDIHTNGGSRWESQTRYTNPEATFQSIGIQNPWVEGQPLVRYMFLSELKYPQYRNFTQSFNNVTFEMAYRSLPEGSGISNFYAYTGWGNGEDLEGDDYVLTGFRIYNKGVMDDDFKLASYADNGEIMWEYQLQEKSSSNKISLKPTQTQGEPQGFWSFDILTAPMPSGTTPANTLNSMIGIFDSYKEEVCYLKDEYLEYDPFYKKFGTPSSTFHYSQSGNGQGMFKSIEYYGNTMGGAGCGMYALSHAFSIMTQRIVNPAEVFKAVMSYNSRHNTSYQVHDGGAIIHEMIGRVAEEFVYNGKQMFNVEVDQNTSKTQQEVENALSKNGVAIIVKPGHYVCIYGKAPDGRYLVADSVNWAPSGGQAVNGSEPIPWSNLSNSTNGAFIGITPGPGYEDYLRDASGSSDSSDDSSNGTPVKTVTVNNLKFNQMVDDPFTKTFTGPFLTYEAKDSSDADAVKAAKAYNAIGKYAYSSVVTHSRYSNAPRGSYDRTDCSGYVSLVLADAFGDQGFASGSSSGQRAPLTSGCYGISAAQVVQKYFYKVDPSSVGGPQNLQPFDVLHSDGHVAFAMGNGKLAEHKGPNGGEPWHCDTDVNLSRIDCIWRLKPEAIALLANKNR